MEGAPRAFADQLNSLRLDLARRGKLRPDCGANTNIDVQPRLETRPGYRLNIPVDQDIVFREPTIVNREWGSPWQHSHPLTYDEGEV